GTPPKECNPALHRFYSIHHKYAQDTISARRRFLQQCPASRDKEIAPIIEIVVHR
ncbi:TrbM/KikA/MpfK family conjugal transfer protein, partial [Neisseria sp. P0016.S002]